MFWMHLSSSPESIISMGKANLRFQTPYYIYVYIYVYIVWSLKTQVCFTHRYYTLWGRREMHSKHIWSNLQELPRRICENNIKMNLKESGCKVVDWKSYVSQCRTSLYQRRLQMGSLPSAVCYTFIKFFEHHVSIKTFRLSTRTSLRTNELLLGAFARPLATSCRLPA